MRRIIQASRALALFMGLLSMDAVAQENQRKPRYEFVKANGKPKFLKKYRTIELHLKDSLAPIPNISRSHRVEGLLLFTTQDSIAVNLWEEEWWETQMAVPPELSYPVPVRWKSQKFSAMDTTEIPRSYALDRIDHVSYEPNLVNAGAAITVISAIGLLIYAPLKAMKFKEGTFDGDKYIQVATPCLIGVGVGLVMMPFTEGKRRVKVKLGQ